MVIPTMCARAVLVRSFMRECPSDVPNALYAIMRRLTIVYGDTYATRHFVAS